MKKIKKFIILLIFGFVIIGVFSPVNATNTDAPSYYDDFSSYLLDDTPDGEGRVENVFDLGIDPNVNLKQNIRCLFYPNNYSIGCKSSARGGLIRDVFRYIGYGILVLCIVLVGMNLLIHGSDAARVKKELKSLLYILIGSLLFFGAIWILGSVLGVEDISGSEGLITALQGGETSLLFKVLTLLKALAFFIAIIMIVVYGFKTITLSDKADKAKAGFKGITNVLIALVSIKVIDYVYYIASLEDFALKAGEFIIEIAKILGFIVGAFMIIMVFYAGFLLITDQGKGDSMKKAKNLIIGVLVGSLVIFMLLLIMYQLFAEFA